MIAAIAVSHSNAISLSVFSSLMVNDSERVVRFSPSVLCEQVADVRDHVDGKRVLVAIIVGVEASAPVFLAVPSEAHFHASRRVFDGVDCPVVA